MIPDRSDLDRARAIVDNTPIKRVDEKDEIVIIGHDKSWLINAIAETPKNEREKKG